MNGIEENLIVGSALVGITNMIQMQFPQIKGIYALAISLVLGILAGWFHLFGISGIEEGIITALASSGVYKVAQKAGGN